MKTIGKLSLLAGIVLLLVGASSFVTGCATKQAVTTTNPSTGMTTTTGWVYAVPSIVSNVPGIIQSAAPFVPPPYGEAVGIFGAGLSAVLAWYLKNKNASLKDANAALVAIQQAAMETHLSKDLQTELFKTAADNSITHHPIVNSILMKPAPKENTPGTPIG